MGWGIQMSILICPVCKVDLIKKDKIFACENDHHFDISKHGYVNLLMSARSKHKRHGDDKLMLISRSDFLDKGYYDILLNSLIDIMSSHISDDINILDAGCGEGFYTANIMKYLDNTNINYKITGIDISKDALKISNKRNKKINLVVSSIVDIPIRDKSLDIILNIFAPASSQEYYRTLKSGALLIKVIPLEKHLWDLKVKIYDEPYENKIDDLEIDGFKLEQKVEIKENINLQNNEDIVNLFKMTPYYYKTKKEDQEKINTLTNLDVGLEFLILVYKKI